MPTVEERVKEGLTKRFPALADRFSVVRPRRMLVEVPLDIFPEVFEYCFTSLGFGHLCAITGLDEQDKLGFVYHLAQEGGAMLNVKTAAAKVNPVIKSIIKVFPSAEVYERELVDLFGAVVEGLPPGNRYPLTDDWPAGEYPLRKDWHPKQETKGA